MKNTFDSRSSRFLKEINVYLSVLQVVHVAPVRERLVQLHQMVLYATVQLGPLERGVN